MEVIKTIEQIKKAYYHQKLIGDMSKDEIIQMYINLEDNYYKNYNIIRSKLDTYRETFGIAEFDK